MDPSKPKTKTTGSKRKENPVTSKPKPAQSKPPAKRAKTDAGPSKPTTTQTTLPFIVGTPAASTPVTSTPVTRPAAATTTATSVSAPKTVGVKRLASVASATSSVTTTATAKQAGPAKVAKAASQPQFSQSRLAAQIASVTGDSKSTASATNGNGTTSGNESIFVGGQQIAAPLPLTQEQQQKAKTDAKLKAPVVGKSIPSMTPVAKESILTNYYAIPKSKFESSRFEQHREWLTMTPKDNSGMFMSKKSASFKIFSEDDKYFYVPRFYGLARWGMPPAEQVRTKEGTAMHADVQFTGQLADNPPQKKTVKIVLDHLHDPTKPPGGIISLPCGFGKTVVSFYLAWKLNKRTLFLAHSSALMEQAIERCKQFLPAARIGRLQQDTIEIEDRDVIFGTIQSLVARAYPQDLLDTIGLVIVDEAHHIAAQSFCKSMVRIRPRYMLGLSATPKRKDGLTNALHYWLGPMIHREERTWEHVYGRIEVYNDGNNEEMKFRSGMPNRPGMITRMITDPLRNAKIVDLVMEALTEVPEVRTRTVNGQEEEFLPGERYILVVSERLAHLKILHTAIASKWMRLHGGIEAFTITPEGKNTTRLVANDNDTTKQLTLGYYVGSQTKEQYQAAAQCRVVLATTQMVNEGVDIPRMDTIVMCTPIGNREQAVGRILRVHPEKNIPMVLYIADPVSFFRAMTFAMDRYLKSEDYEVTWNGRFAQNDDK